MCTRWKNLSKSCLPILRVSHSMTSQTPLSGVSDDNIMEAASKDDLGGTWHGAARSMGARETSVARPYWSSARYLPTNIATSSPLAN